MIPYGRQNIDDDDVASVKEVLASDWLTTGPKVKEFEDAVADYVGAKYAVAVSSGTAALHTAAFALGIGSGDDVVVPSMTFVSTANSVVFLGGNPVFADVSAGDLLIDAGSLEHKMTSDTKAVIAVDYAGQPCDYDRIRDVAERNEVPLMADASHSLGAVYKDRRVGSICDITAFSFHPVKHITTGEGGMIVTDNPRYAERARRFRNHGISADRAEREKAATWEYDMVDLGFNYRLTDLQSALGISQLKKLDSWIARRNDIAGKYDEAFSKSRVVEPLVRSPEVIHAYHLYVVKLPLESMGVPRETLFKELRGKDIGVNVHYMPVHMHSYYMNRFGTSRGLCPVAEDAYERIISLPLYPSMSDEQSSRVISTVEDTVGEYTA
ncbi:MAG: UDP-4-amino-4,6-dideoxy-N-acetyl-beta-L-altrosamine transaminase [Methanobacteriota archaeon]|nr:MAG: UDP-4-amino-4,6-dideoxy-N-acetyl-beta-L-altrosamine transaminase [Euryarchaeota archaeon]